MAIIEKFVFPRGSKIRAETPAERIARLFVHARRALGTQAEANVFMTSAHPELDGRRPLDLAESELGAQRAERLLTALEYGLAL